MITGLLYPQPNSKRCGRERNSHIKYRCRPIYPSDQFFPFVGFPSQTAKDVAGKGIPSLNTAPPPFIHKTYFSPLWDSLLCIRDCIIYQPYNLASTSIIFKPFFLLQVVIQLPKPTKNSFIEQFVWSSDFQHSKPTLWVLFFLKKG